MVRSTSICQDDNFKPADHLIEILEKVIYWIKSRAGHTKQIHPFFFHKIPEVKAKKMSANIWGETFTT
jgi:hypothetical protein